MHLLKFLECFTTNPVICRQEQRKSKRNDYDWNVCDRVELSLCPINHFIRFVIRIINLVKTKSYVIDPAITYAYHAFVFVLLIRFKESKLCVQRMLFFASSLSVLFCKTLYFGIHSILISYECVVFCEERERESAPAQQPRRWSVKSEIIPFGLKCRSKICTFLKDEMRSGKNQCKWLWICICTIGRRRIWSNRPCFFYPPFCLV